MMLQLKVEEQLVPLYHLLPRLLNPFPYLGKLFIFILLGLPLKLGTIYDSAIRLAPNLQNASLFLYSLVKWSSLHSPWILASQLLRPMLVFLLT